jgi:ABC-type phosphate/phosphonate transport system substrate-binding protein
MTTAPTQSVKRTHELYGPLAEYLSQATGKQVKLVPVHNFLEYTSKMRKDEFDIIFDGPHFVSWRMTHTDHVPSARLPGELVFMAAVKDGGTISKIGQLVGKKVCAVNSPNLATLMVLDAFPNPVRQPVIVSQRSFKDAMQCLKDGKGVAAILPIKFWKKFEKKGKTKGLRLLYTTKKQPLPPRTFSISKRVDATMRAKIRQALLDSEGKPGAQPLLNRFRSKNFVAAGESEYDDLSRLLLSVWGFHE